MFDETGKAKVRAQFVSAATAANQRVSVFATVSCNHAQILTKAPDTVVASIDHVVQRSA